MRSREGNAVTTPLPTSSSPPGAVVPGVMTKTEVCGDTSVAPEAGSAVSAAAEPPLQARATLAPLTTLMPAAVATQASQSLLPNTLSFCHAGGARAPARSRPQGTAKNARQASRARWQS